MTKVEYIINNNHNSDFKKYCGFDLSIPDIMKAIHQTNETLTTLPYTVFQSIDFKSTSGMIGALFCKGIENHTDGIVNPIEKGYPDIIPNISPELFNEATLKNYPVGLEVKCTAGNLKTGSNLITGETRIEKLSSITWQAHHREGDRLLGLTWDFVQFDGSTHSFPIITGAFYSNDLAVEDWGEISGTTGRNTKVTGMSKSGKIKMGKGWVAILNDERYVSRYKRIFNIESL